MADCHNKSSSFLCLSILAMSALEANAFRRTVTETGFLTCGTLYGSLTLWEFGKVASSEK